MTRRDQTSMIAIRSHALAMAVQCANNGKWESGSDRAHATVFYAALFADFIAGATPGSEPAADVLEARKAG